MVTDVERSIVSPKGNAPHNFFLRPALLICLANHQFVHTHRSLTSTARSRRTRCVRLLLEELDTVSWGSKKTALRWIGEDTSRCVVIDRIADAYHPTGSPRLCRNRCGTCGLTADIRTNNICLSTRLDTLFLRVGQTKLHRFWLASDRIPMICQVWSVLILFGTNLAHSLTIGLS